MNQPSAINDTQAKVENPTDPDWVLPNAMLSGALTEIIDSEFPTIVFQKALKLLPQKEGELVASVTRTRVIEEVKRRDNAAREGIGQRLKTLFKKQEDQPFLKAEIEALSQVVDRDSFAMQATLADMHAAAGNMEAFEKEYTAALQAARKGGYAVIE